MQLQSTAVPGLCCRNLIPRQIIYVKCERKQRTPGHLQASNCTEDLDSSAKISKAFKRCLNSVL